jgi:hypothetical protein
MRQLSGAKYAQVIVIRAFLVCLIAFEVCVHSTYGSQLDALRIVEEVDLEDALKTEGSVTVMAGEGLSLRFLPRDPKVATETKRQLVVIYKGRKVKSLSSSHYLRYTRLEAGPAMYWQIEEWTGGAHCCTRYHFFCRPGPNEPLKYVGATAASEGETPFYEGPFIFQNGKVYFEDVDIRFVYFHTSYARSQIFLPCFYRLTPSSLTIDNRAFKERYLKEIAGVEEDVNRTVSGRCLTSVSMVTSEDEFSDELTQLLVKRTILYLYAREDNRAWQTLERDAAKYYKTSGGLQQLKREIIKILNRNPY